MVEVYGTKSETGNKMVLQINKLAVIFNADAYR